MKVCSVSLRRLVASGMILAFTIIPIPSVTAQGIASIEDLPLSPVERAQQDGTALLLSLTEFTKLVLQNNLDIAIQDTNEENRRWALSSAYGAYDPTLTLSTTLSSNRTVSTNAFDISTSAGSTTSDSFRYGITFRQPLKTGGSISVTHQPGRTSTNSNMSTMNPSYSGSLNISFSQSLWRNLRIDNTRNQIKLANLNIEMNEVEFRQSVTTTIANAQTRYWSLVSAIRNYEIQRNSVRLAMINLRDQQRRLEVGTIPPIDVTTAEATVTSRELNLISAEDQILQAQNNLRQLASSDRNSDVWKRVIVPTDLPDFIEYKIDADTAVAIAIKNSPQLERLRMNTTQLNMQNRLSRENKKWDVSLSSSFQLSGSAGQVVEGYEGRYKPSVNGGLPTYYKMMFSDPGTNWSVGFNISVPLRNRNLEATLAQQEIQKRQYLMQERQNEQNIQLDVTNALQSLESSRRQIIAAENSRRVAVLQLEGEVKRNDAGLSQNYRVLESQQALAQQELSVLQAQISYKQAIITLQRTMNNLLDASDFSVARGSSSNIPNFR